jgi:hypothetical protein
VKKILANDEKIYIKCNKQMVKKIAFIVCELTNKTAQKLIAIKQIINNIISRQYASNLLV